MNNSDPLIPLPHRFIDKRRIAVYVHDRDDRWYQMVLQGALKPLLMHPKILYPQSDGGVFVRQMLEYFKAKPIDQLVPVEQGVLIIDQKERYLAGWHFDAANPFANVIDVQRVPHVLAWLHQDGVEHAFDQMLMQVSAWGIKDVLPEYIWVQKVLDQARQQGQTVDANNRLPWIATLIQDKLERGKQAGCDDGALMDYLNLGNVCVQASEPETWSGHLRERDTIAGYETYVCVGAAWRDANKVAHWLEQLSVKNPLPWDLRALQEYTRKSMEGKDEQSFKALCAVQEKLLIEQSTKAFLAPSKASAPRRAGL